MTRLFKRAGWSLVVVWAVLTLTFAIHHWLPTDPARMAAGPQARPEEVQRIRKELELDRPFLVQYARFATRFLHLAGEGAAPDEHRSCAALGPVHLDLGKSYQQRRPVTAILSERVPRTLWLAAAAVALQLAIGVSLGVLAAHKRRSFGPIATAVSLIGVSAPTFLIGLGLQYLLGYRLRWLPIDGFGQSSADHARAVILPALTLGLFGAAYYIRLVRDEMVTALSRDFVRTARAKGAGDLRVLMVHGFRNILVPLSTATALELGALAGGAIVTETLFRWPGLGSLAASALLDRDGPVLMGTVLVTSIVVVLSNLAADLLATVFDARI